MREELKFEKLGKKERKLLLKALDIDYTNLKCQYCNKKVTYDNCAIMPSVNTKELATITCNSPLCVCEYLESFESKKVKPCCEKAIQIAKKEVFDDIDKFNSYGRSTDYMHIIDMSIEDYELLKEKHLGEKFRI